MMAHNVNKKKSKMGILLSFLLMVVGIAFAYNFIITLENQHSLEKEYHDKTTPDPSREIPADSSESRTTSVPPSKINPDSSLSASPDKLNSSNAILIRLGDNTTLMKKNSEDKIYPASLTKMMTAIVAIEKLSDLNEEVELTHYTFNGLYSADASMAGFEAGEKVREMDLLYGVLLPSGAEACIGLADHIAGSEQGFVEMMNQKAAELGMDNTHFENSTGLHDENHYTTVKDLSILLSYALQNDTFREIFTSPRHFIPPTNKHPDGMTVYNTMFEKLYDQTIMDGEILGGKTGYTDEAGLCLASLAKVGKEEYILITAGAKGDIYSEQYNITDALAVYNGIGE